MPKDKKKTKSARLRKYGSVYKKHMKGKETTKKKPKLNEYQKFVQKESGKEKYKSMKGSERLNAIATEWDNKKKKRRIKKS